MTLSYAKDKRNFRAVGVLALVALLWASPALAQFTDIKTNGTATSDSVTFQNQKLYRFPVRAGMFYRVNVAPSAWEDVDLYGHYNSSVSQANGVNNHGFSCRANDGLEHFAFQSNYGGYYYLAVYAYGRNATFNLSVQEFEPPALSLQAPSPIGTWTIGQNALLSWTGDFDDYRIRISRNGGAWSDLVQPVNGLYSQSDSPFSWTVTGPAAQSCRIHVLGRNVMYSERTVPYTVKGVWHTPGDPPTGVSGWEVRIVEGQAQDHLEVEGSTQVNENDGAQYACWLVRQNGTRQDVTNASHWTIEYGPASIATASGLLTTYDVTYDQPCRIRASYNSIVDSLDVTIKNTAATLNSITVNGPAFVSENSTAQYSCRAFYSDGTNCDVTANASWSDGGSPYVDIAAGGNLTAVAVGANQTCTITANYQGKSSQVSVTIRDLPPPPPSAPLLLSPAAGSTTNAASVTFHWQDLPSETGYWLYVKIDTPNGPIIENDRTIAQDTTSKTILLPALTRYTWKVAAKNGTDNWGNFSSSRTLTYSSPTSSTQTTKNQVNSVEPINTYSGAYLYSHQDLSIPARGLPFEFARFYSSRADTAPARMAPKWRHTYQVSLVENPSDGTVTIHWANCTEDYLTPLGDGQYKNTYPGYSGKLTKNGDGTFDFVTKQRVKYHFGSTGTLLVISDRNSNTLSLVYAGGQLAAVHDGAGRELSFEYTSGRLTTVRDFASPQRSLEFTYDGATGNLHTAKDTRGNTTTYAYDPAYPDGHYLKTIIDRRGKTIVTNVFNADGQVTSQTNARGKTWDYTYNAETGITTETDPQEPTRGVTTYEYNEYAWLVKKTDPKGNFEQYTYDAEGNRTVLDNARRKTTTSTYDAYGNVLTVTDALNNVTSFEYNANDQVTLITDAKGRETRFEYDPRGNLLTVRRPLHHVTQYAYDLNGQLLSVTDAMGRVTTHAYDADGNRVSTTNALGQTINFEYDASGRVTDIIEPLVPPATTRATTHFEYWEDDSVKSIRDQEGNTTYFEYDANGNRTKVRNPRTFETTFTYNDNNLLETVTDAYTKTTVTVYDPADRVASVTDRWAKQAFIEYDLAGNPVKTTAPDTSFTEFGYDENGNRTSVTNANGHTFSLLYDEVDRLWKTIDALGNTTENSYDEVGRLVKVKNANAKETEYAFDDLDRLTQIKDPTAGTLQFAYDLNGNRISITDPNNHTTQFEYDALNRVITEMDPVGKGYRYEYDPSGNLSKRTDTRNNITTYEYYLNHRLKAIHYPGGTPPVTFTYDANGNRTQMTDANGDTTWVYDNLDRLTQVTDPFGNTVGYAYDLPSDVRKRIVYPGAKNVDYAFDANGRLQSLTDWAGHTFTYHYDAAGNVTQLDYPNSTKEKRTYYANERLKTLAHEKPDATQFIAYNYYYDGTGNITGMDRKEPVARAFQAELTNYSYNTGNEIQTAGTSAFSFDASGNQASQATPAGTSRFTFDVENRLTQITPSTGIVSQFTYNGLGDRIASNEGTAKRYLLDLNKGMTDVLADLDASNAPQQYYLYGLGLVGRVTPSGDLSEYHPDHLGSIMAVTDETNAVTAAFAYDEFGAVAASSGTEAGPWRFCGAIGLQEAENGVHFVRARYYEKITGRMLSHDPVMLAMSTQRTHPYAYCSNSPLVTADPSGLVQISDPWANTLLMAEDLLHVVKEGASVVGSSLEAGKDIATLDFAKAGLDMVNAVDSLDKAFGYSGRIGENAASWMSGGNLNDTEEVAGPYRQLLRAVAPDKYDQFNNMVDRIEFAGTVVGLFSDIPKVIQNADSAASSLNLWGNATAMGWDGAHKYLDVGLEKFMLPALSVMSTFDLTVPGYGNTLGRTTAGSTQKTILGSNGIVVHATK